MNDIKTQIFTNIKIKTPWRRSFYNGSMFVSAFAAVNCVGTKLFFDTEKLVVLRYAVSAAE